MMHDKRCRQSLDSSANPTLENIHGGENEVWGLTRRLGIRQAWLQILALLLINYTVLGKPLNVSNLQLLHL